jgi:hypothetical protein
MPRSLSLKYTEWGIIGMTLRCEREEKIKLMDYRILNGENLEKNKY